MNTPEFGTPATLYAGGLVFLNHVDGFDIWFDTVDTMGKPYLICWGPLHHDFDWLAVTHDGSGCDRTGSRECSPAVTEFILAHWAVVS